MSTLIPIERIIANPWQTRATGSPSTDTDGEYIKDLALDIARNGLLQIPVGRLVKDGKPLDSKPYGGEGAALNDEPGSMVQLAFGHNRLAAFKWLVEVKDHSDLEGDWSQMEVELRELSDEQMADFAWSENEKRRELNPLERALAIEKRMQDFGWNQKEIAGRLGVSQPVVSNALRLLKLPSAMRAALSEGSLTERQAMALLPLFDLGDQVLTAANEGYTEGYTYHTRPDQIVAEAISGSNSDRIREQVEQVYAEWTKNLQDAEWELNDLFPEGDVQPGCHCGSPSIYCGLCSTCDKRLSSRNQCLDKTCFAAKVEYSHRRYLEQAIFVSGIKVAATDKGGYTTQISGPYFSRILETKCENLCLEYGYGVEASNSVPGFPQARIRCDKRNDSCTCLKGLVIGQRIQNGSTDIDQRMGMDKRITEEGQAAPASITAAELEEIARQARREKKDATSFLQPARELLTERLTRDLAEGQPGAFYGAAHSFLFPHHEELELEKIYRYMANQLANHIVPDYLPDSVDELEKRINNHLVALELEPIYLMNKPLVEVMATGSTDENG